MKLTVTHEGKYRALGHIKTPDWIRKAVRGKQGLSVAKTKCSSSTEGLGCRNGLEKSLEGTVLNSVVA